MIGFSFFFFRLYWGLTKTMFLQGKFALTKVSRSKRQRQRWPIYVIDSSDDTKLPCYTLPPTQHHSSLRNLPYLFDFFVQLVTLLLSL